MKSPSLPPHKPISNFVRQLIDEQRIPEDVTIQVLTQARDPLILRTFEALRGARRATVHLYNATAPLFRELVFGMDKAEVIALATRATRLIRQQCEQQPETRWQYEYSPETFCFTEPEFALEICEAVADVWQPCAERPMIVNLPATVEVNTPTSMPIRSSIFAATSPRRGEVCISVHPHNDRGTGVASAELAVMAGADRVEGCLFGNGERTGNVCLVTLAMNLYSQGIDPEASLRADEPGGGGGGKLQPDPRSPAPPRGREVWLTPPSPAPIRMRSKRV
ncbi:hypothetical protein LN650_07825 [Klebsiella pneumoniae subsp. pneumoniae]|nr:hypothetical protein [Klebsiella pneumoniae subsp. pneumoniae]